LTNIERLIALLARSSTKNITVIAFRSCAARARGETPAASRVRETLARAGSS